MAEKGFVSISNLLAAIYDDLKHQQEDIIRYVLIHHYYEKPNADIYKRVFRVTYEGRSNYEEYYLDQPEFGKHIASFEVNIDHDNLNKPPMSYMTVKAVIPIPEDV